jgi:hypothetical protein
MDVTVRLPANSPRFKLFQFINLPIDDVTLATGQVHTAVRSNGSVVLLFGSIRSTDDVTVVPIQSVIIGLIWALK